MVFNPVCAVVLCLFTGASWLVRLVSVAFTCLVVFNPLIATCVLEVFKNFTISPTSCSGRSPMVSFLCNFVFRLAWSPVFSNWYDCFCWSQVDQISLMLRSCCCFWNILAFQFILCVSYVGAVAPFLPVWELLWLVLLVVNVFSLNLRFLWGFMLLPKF